MHNVVKWPNILYKFCGVHTARFLKCVRPFCNIMHERVKKFLSLPNNRSFLTFIKSVDISHVSIDWLKCSKMFSIVKAASDLQHLLNANSLCII